MDVNMQVPVLEIMSRKPVTASPEITVNEAAVLMKKKRVGSLVIVERTKPVGIVTERDILIKVVASNLKPNGIALRDIMSTPVVTISSHMDIYKAAEKMASLHIRRLPVVDNSMLVGMVTESDIIKISPHLIEITREIARINTGVERETRGISGYCENCKSFSDRLTNIDGQLLCRNCIEGK